MAVPDGKHVCHRIGDQTAGGFVFDPEDDRERLTPGFAL
ncbi:hypothetical protein FRUB_10348 [Fimbriiglobus ruber]|uniref:Uncharacterized protein n=1 Tax=Fimbriiglobus ruber TaxID=1908690 RepID=A0A225DE29_9BACT|nr:hypothetical protein FRUB_10348 [Fimbriiglobus ruber]